MEAQGAGSSRRRAREVALQVLYALDLGAGHVSSGGTGPRAQDAVESTQPAGTTAELPEPSSMFEAVAANFEMPEGARDFARELVERVHENLDQLDRSISHHSSNWRIERMAAVDRNILRLGTYELTHTATPAPVILNEAIDLARRFSNDPSPAFVNGILDAVARVVRECDP